MNITNVYSILFVRLIFFILMMLPLLDWMPTGVWYDGQRIGQIALVLASVVFGFWRGLFLKRGGHFGVWGCVILILLILCAISAYLSNSPYLAFLEIATYVGCLALAWVLVSIRDATTSKVLDEDLIFWVVLLSSAITWKFAFLYFVSIVDGVKAIDIWELITGFQNIRFFGQFCTMVIPLLALPLMKKQKSKILTTLIFLVFSFFWMMAIASGTRGTLLGILASAIIIFIAGGIGRLWIRVQIIGVIVGTVIYMALFLLVPKILSIQIMHSALERVNSSMSSRDVLWKQAIEMIWERPWFGYGPMHYASVVNPYAAHPHQAILQWASELGVPATLILIGTILFALKAVVQRLRSHLNSDEYSSLTYTCLAASVIAIFVQSLVDGVFVVPYTELWFTIICAWLYSLHNVKKRIEIGQISLQGAMIGAVFFSASILLLSTFMFHQYKSLDEYSQLREVFMKRFQPRFWLHGVIR